MLRDIPDFMRGIPAPDNLPYSHTDNPFWDIVRTIPGNRFEWERYQRWEPDGFATFSTNTYRDRQSLCVQYAWAIPDPDSLTFLAQHLTPKAVEMGAGTGYFAWQMQQFGVDMLAYDLAPPDSATENHWHSPRKERGELTGVTRPIFFPVQQGTPDILVHYPERTLFLCWPPYESDMAAQCLRHYPGNKLVSIGEHAGGCTGDDAFFEQLDEVWQEVDGRRPVQWWGIHDWITVYTRKHRP